MPKLPSIRKILSAFFTVLVLVAVCGVFLFFFFRLNIISSDLNSVSIKQDNLEKIYLDALYEDHLKVSEQIKMSAELENLSIQLEELSKKQDNSDYLAITEILTSYKLVSAKLTRNTNSKLSVSAYSDTLVSLGKLLLDRNFTEAKTSLQTMSDSLEKEYKDYLATLPPPPSVTGEGYSFVNVDSERGRFGIYLIKVPLGNMKVVTASANGDNCSDNCPAKSLEEHVKNNNGYAGMNSAYFCPPDYASCSGKINSSDYAFYKTSSGKWLNEDALSWGDTGLATFNGNSAKFYKESSDYDGDSVTAGVSNYPTLLEDGDVVIDTGDLTSYQKDVKGLRGAIGVGKNNLYLAIVVGATVPDAAYALKALGVLDALNLDGGGSSAMYINGAYVVGPGRKLPNAIVLTK